jgi:hypothetical protein
VRRRTNLTEGAVIVLSILLAFAIDAGWDARSAARDEAALRNAIRADMATTLEALDGYAGAMELLSERTERFLEATPEALAQFEPDTAAVFLRGFVAASGTFTPSNGALRTSDLSLMGDQELRARLGSWLLAAEDAAEDLPTLESGAREVALRSGVVGAPRAVRDAALFPEVGTTPSVLAQLRGEPEFIDALLIHDGKRRRNLNKLATLRRVTLSVLERLSAHLP